MPSFSEITTSPIALLSLTSMVAISFSPLTYNSTSPSFTVLSEVTLISTVTLSYFLALMSFISTVTGHDTAYNICVSPSTVAAMNFRFSGTV